MPANGIERHPEGGGRWIATGDDPFFHVAMEVGARPRGWCRLLCRLVGEAGLVPEPSLYIDDGFGFSEDDRIRLTVRDGLVDHVLHLPHEVRALRFDPCEGPGRFEAEGFDLAPLAADDPRQRLAPPPTRTAYRNDDLRVLAAEDLGRIPERPDGWIATRSDPQFHVTVRSIASRRSRWIRIAGKMTSLDGGQLRPTAYLRTSEGFAEGNKQYLREVEGGFDDVLYVPAGTVGLRLDPLEGTGRFTFSELSIRPARPAAAWASVARKFLATVPKDGGSLRPLASSAWRHLRHFSRSEILEMAVRRANRPPMERAYAAWIEAVERPALADAGAAAGAIAAFRTRPLFSILVPVYETPKEWLIAAIESVRAQVYPHWELCLCDDASPSRHVGEILARYAVADPRIKVVTRRENGHISRATNDALALATGTHMVLMDHDDLIAPDALYEFARVLDAEPEIDLVYSDEDKISTAGVRYGPFFKPDWSPDTLEGCMYTAHLACYAMGLVRDVGDFRPECDGSQDYDFVLRFTERARRVRHVARILYHWRAVPGSTAAEMASKAYTTRAAIRALQARGERTGTVAFARAGAYAGAYELRRAIVARPAVSIVIAEGGPDPFVEEDRLARCLDGIARTGSFGPVEIVVVDGGETGAGSLEASDRHGARRVAADAPGLSARLNEGARASRGDLLLFLRDDLEMITPDGLESLVAAVQVPGVGIAGPKIHRPDGSLHSAGVTFHEGLPLDIRRGYPETDSGYAYSSVARRNYMALNGACLMMRRSVFVEAGGFDEDLPDLGGVDHCLRAWSRGHRVVFEPMARFRLAGSPVEVDPAQAARFRARWFETVRHDPYYPEWLRTNPPNFELDPARYPARDETSSQDLRSQIAPPGFRRKSG